MVVDQYAKSVEKCEVVTWMILFQANEQIASQKTKNSEQEEFYKVKKRTMDLLPDAENNIAKLQVFSSIHVKKKFFWVYTVLPISLYFLPLPLSPLFLVCPQSFSFHNFARKRKASTRLSSEEYSVQEILLNLERVHGVFIFSFPNPILHSHLL